MYSYQNLVNGMKWLPTPRNMAMIVAAKIHHLSFPSHRKSPRRNRKTVIAPTYIGPAVKGCGPQ
ncbi:unknown [Bacteroides sp. CAG:709]|nr:unknown [Bacteroides sp. CAG:709]